MIVIFTDFGAQGPYVGQMKAALLREAPMAPIIDLLADAPMFNPRSSAYLLAALVDVFPVGAVFLCVVDPGVGSDRRALAMAIDGRIFVGPDNGLFEPLLRRAGRVDSHEIVWRPSRLSDSFHGRDLFAPVAARLALGQGWDQAGCVPAPPRRFPDWPDDLAEIVYVDHYGNAMTGIRAATLSSETAIQIGGQILTSARTFSCRGVGQAFWYANSCGLVEIAVNGGRADADLGVRIGDPVALLARN